MFRPLPVPVADISDASLAASLAIKPYFQYRTSTLRSFEVFPVYHLVMHGEHLRCGDAMSLSHLNNSQLPLNVTGCLDEHHVAFMTM